MHQVVKGIVIQAVEYKDADVILTVLTEEMGKISVRARGAKRKNSTLRSACQLFAYSSMTLYEKSGRFSLNEADLIEQFFGISGSIESVSLASYMAQLLLTEAEHAPLMPDVMRLALNGFFALSQGKIGHKIIKAAFELRYISLSGYTPNLDMCPVCQNKPQEGWLGLAGGNLTCTGCPKESGAVFLDSLALKAAKYIVSAPVNRVFSFRIEEDSLDNLAKMCEKYILFSMERTFSALDFYHGLK